MNRFTAVIRAAAFSAALVLSSACAAPGPAEDQRIGAADIRADFDTLYTSLKVSHFDLFARRERRDYDRLHARMRREMTAPMTTVEAQARFQQFMAYGDVAHANIEFPSAAYEAFRSGGGKAFPLYVRFMGARMFIADDLSGLSPSLAGARIVSIDGMSAAALEKRLRAHVSADNAYLARTILEFRMAPLMWLEFGERESFRVVIEAPGGARRAIEVPARARDDQRAAAAANAPVFELNTGERVHKIIDGVGYLRPGPFYNIDGGDEDVWNNASFVTFIDEAFGAMIAANAPALLIDLRANPGGDNSFSDPMVAWFATKPFRFASHFYVRVSDAATAANEKRRTPGDEGSISARFADAYAKARNGDIVDFDLGETPPREGARYNGDVYILIDRHSYSNTVTVAALAQDYGFAKIFGEETADLATTYGAMETFTLPNTAIVVGFPKAHIIRPGGDRSARGVIPDKTIPAPLRASADEMLSAALAEIRKDLAER